MKKRLFASMLTAAMLVGTLTACGSEPAPAASSDSDAQSGAEPAANTPSAEGKVKIGFSLKTVNNPFVVSVKNGAAKAAEEFGAEIIITDAQLDSQKQMTDVESFMQQKVDAILIDALDSTALLPTVQDANDQGFKILTEDSRITGAEDIVLSHVGIDNEKSGERIAQYLVDEMKKQGKKNIIIFEGLPGAEATTQRAKGFHTVLDNNSDVNILFAKNVGDKREEGLQNMDDMLQKFDNIDAVICCNDELALGAISSIEGAGREGILVTGFDGNSDGLQAVKDGRMLATIDHAPYTMGYIAVETCIKAAKGESVDKATVFDVELVDSSNVDEIIAKHANE